MGLRGDMKLETASGPVEIRRLADRASKAPDFSEVAFVWTGARFFATEVSQFQMIGQQQLFEVMLDDGQAVQVSASSQFVMKSGGLKIPQELRPGDSLLALYIKDDKHGYPTCRVPGKAAKRKISRLMAEWRLGHELVRGTCVEHVDGNRKNYHPDNLRIIVDERRAVRSHKNAVVKVVEQANKLFEECAAASPKMAKIVKLKKKKRKSNHKVASVVPGLLGDVYTAFVRSGGSLSVSGVFLNLPSC